MARKISRIDIQGMMKGRDKKMKVLIVEDDNNKAQQVKNAITEGTGVNKENVDVVPGINEAIQKMLNEKYQFMIADMCIPNVYGEKIEEDGGLQLIKVITQDKRVLKPADIVVLTAHEGMIEKYRDKIEKESFSMIAYDSSSEEWKRRIRDRLVYILSYDTSPNKKRDYEYDVAIITAVQVEKEAVLKLSENWGVKPVEGDSAIYYETEWECNGRNKKIIATSLTQMGMVAAATLTTKIVYNFSPRYIIMPGIAGGVKGEYEFGDIILPREVKDYCSGKYTTPSSGEEAANINPLDFFVPTATSISTDADIINKASQDFDKILGEIHKKWPQNDKYKSPRIRTGYMASGDSVVQNEAVIDMMIKNHLRQADGLDMEAYGVYYAAQQAIMPKPIPICMKAISDFADKKKSDEHQAYAAYTSAQFTKYFVQEIL